MKNTYPKYAGKIKHKTGSEEMYIITDCVHFQKLRLDISAKFVIPSLEK